MSGPDLSQPPLYQSPQFQHEFPSLSVGDGGGPARVGSEVQYAPGLSLRPQTEGSWIQGGSRPGVDPAGPPRSSSVPLGAPPQLAAQVGLPQQQLPPQFRAVMPTFVSCFLYIHVSLAQYNLCLLLFIYVYCLFIYV